MARTRKLSPERKAFINGLIEHYHPEDAQDVQEMLKDLLGDYSRAAEPPVRCGESHLSGLTEPPSLSVCLISYNTSS